MCTIPRRAVVFALAAVGVLLGSTSAFGQNGPTADPSKPRCAFGRQDHPEYVLWICNSEGTAHSQEATILRTRTNRAGAEVVSRVWSGPLAELVRDVESIIVTHASEHARCTSYFHLARTGRPGPSWNVASRAMLDWWAREGASRFSNVCYTSEPSAADYIVMWAGNDVPLPNAFSMDLPSARASRASAGLEELSADPSLNDAGRALSSLAVYQVNAGFDGAVLRLGPTLLSVDPPTEDAAPDTDSLVLAIRFLAALPR